MPQIILANDAHPREAGSERVKMTCPSCSYSCYPQWLNDEATCLKCFTVLRRRSMGAGVGAGVAVLDVRRQPGEVSTFKHSMVGAMESESGCCPKGPRGAHQWRFGKCSYCAKAEPPGSAGGLFVGGGCSGVCTPPSPMPALRPPPTPMRPSTPLRPGTPLQMPAAERQRSSSRCGSRRASEVEVLIDAPHDVELACYERPRSGSRAGSRTRADGHHFSFTLHPDAAHDGLVEHFPPRSSSRSSSRTATVDRAHDHAAFPMFPEPAGAAEPRLCAGRNDRAKVECTFCGYKCVPQWLNDQAHCLKCQAVLKVQESVHHSPRSSSVGSSGGGRRMPGEVSTYKVAPGDAMLHSSGSCARSPSGMHLWRFGRCDHCGKPEGKILGGGGAVANPGGSCVSSCSAGGKCMYKFAKCTKCGKKEF